MPFPCNVPGCTVKPFDCQAHLAHHYRSKHNAPAIPCGIGACPRGLSTPNAAYSHRKKFHAKEVIECPLSFCKAAFAAEADLVVHNATTKGHHGEYQCLQEGCGARYTVDWALQKHQSKTGHCGAEVKASVLQKYVKLPDVADKLKAGEEQVINLLANMPSLPAEAQTRIFLWLRKSTSRPGSFAASIRDWAFSEVVLGVGDSNGRPASFASHLMARLINGDSLVAEGNVAVVSRFPTFTFFETHPTAIASVAEGLKFLGISWPDGQKAVYQFYLKAAGVDIPIESNAVINKTFSVLGFVLVAHGLTKKVNKNKVIQRVFLASTLENLAPIARPRDWLPKNLAIISKNVFGEVQAFFDETEHEGFTDYLASGLPTVPHATRILILITYAKHGVLLDRLEWILSAYRATEEFKDYVGATGKFGYFKRDCAVLAAIIVCGGAANTNNTFRENAVSAVNEMIYDEAIAKEEKFIKRHVSSHKIAHYQALFKAEINGYVEKMRAVSKDLDDAELSTIEKMFKLVKIVHGAEDGQCEKVDDLDDIEDTKDTEDEDEVDGSKKTAKRRVKKGNKRGKSFKNDDASDATYEEEEDDGEGAKRDASEDAESPPPPKKLRVASSSKTTLDDN